jgi:hypothetical protein
VRACDLAIDIARQTISGRLRFAINMLSFAIVVSGRRQQLDLWLGKGSNMSEALRGRGWITFLSAASKLSFQAIKTGHGDVIDRFRAIR